jgi:NAD(P)-dependent dehydrogenase (short-subunit alcohol dehydrogenase family)
MTIKQSLTDPYQGEGLWKSLTKTWHNKPYDRISPSRPELSAKGKVVFITGAGTGIGKAIALGFAEAGARSIAIFGRRVNKLEETTQEIQKINDSVQVIPISVDLTQRLNVEKAFNEAATLAGGTVDIYINNHGISPQPGPLAGFSESEWRRTIESNMMSTFFALQAVLAHLAPKAKVIEVSSGMGHISPKLGIWAYSATHAANTKLFQYLQAENPHLWVVSTQPGVVETELNAQYSFRGQDEGNIFFCCSPTTTHLRCVGVSVYLCVAC